MVLLLLILFNFQVEAEPWLANRFSQNCVGCHEAGRYNKKLSERRCTLSCQGCHVNPNGGGLRNQYGKFNSNNWLHSISSDKPKLPLNNKAEKNWQITAKSLTEWLGTVPESDPYYKQRNNKFNFGADFRYLLGTMEGDDVPTGWEDLSFPMALDLAVQFRPIKENLSVVFEQRYFNNPSQKDLEDLLTNQSKVRSAYVMYDDFWMNSWVMGGLYRPMFGYYQADHNSLAQEISGLDQYAVAKAVGFGTSPNVPFFNAHYIQRMNDRGYSKISGDEGFNVNAGLRFVTLGGSFKASYWNTKNRPDNSTEELDNEMISFSLGAKLWRMILNGEVLSFEKEGSGGAKDSGNVYTFETRTRLWRENYLVLNAASATTARDRSEGEATEFVAGFKSFLWSGTEIEATHVTKATEDGGLDKEQKILQILLHAYF